MDKSKKVEYISKVVEEICKKRKFVDDIKSIQFAGYDYMNMIIEFLAYFKDGEMIEKVLGIEYKAL